MKHILLFALLFSSPILLIAQGDTHYWSIQFGARSSFLGGSVIAGLDDNSAVYYNPANLAFIKQSTVSLSASVYKYDNILIGNGAGQGVDLLSQKISLYQQMISGLLTKNPEKRWRMGFNILARQNANIDLNDRYNYIGDVIQNSTDTIPEHYIGTIQLSNALSETWGCLGVGVKISENFSVGLTAIATYRNQQHTFAYAGHAYKGDSPTNISIYTSSFYLHTRTNIIGGLLKAGFHGRIGKWRFGLNITSPSLTIWGESKIQFEESTTVRDTVRSVQTTEQSNLRSVYKYPLSIGTGIAYVYKTGQFSFSAEYFMAMPRYQMIKSNRQQASFPAFLNANTTTQKNDLTVFHGARHVLNWAIGWEQQLSEKIKLHFGFRTDFSYAGARSFLNSNAEIPEEKEDLRTRSANLNLFHFSGGVSWRRKASVISIGVNYTHGHNENVTQLVNLTEPTDQNSNWYLFGTPQQTAYLDYHSITLLIGYTYYFALK